MPIALPSSLSSNHWKMRIGAETITIAPPIPKRKRANCRKITDSDAEHNSEPTVIIAAPTTANRLTPNLPVRTPPKIDKRTPGNAASQTRLLATAYVSANSPIKVGRSGGIACRENRKEMDEKTLTKRLTRFPGTSLQHTLRFQEA